MIRKRWKKAERRTRAFGKVFTGKVRQVRLNATMTQTKVTYTAVIAIDHGDGPQLLPYMTAEITLDPQQ